MGSCRSVLTCDCAKVVWLKNSTCEWRASPKTYLEFLVTSSDQTPYEKRMKFLNEIWKFILFGNKYVAFNKEELNFLKLSSNDKQYFTYVTSPAVHLDLMKHLSSLISIMRFSTTLKRKNMQNKLSMEFLGILDRKSTFKSSMCVQVRLKQVRAWGCFS